MAINLSKGQSINLAKDTAKPANQICVGLNWGVINKEVAIEVSGGFLGLGTKTIHKQVKVDVDLDASCVLLNKTKAVLETISYRQLQSKYGCVNHSGDDRQGDTDGDDDLDNEIISVELDRLPNEVDQIIFFLNSFKKQDFAEIPHATIRIYEGTPDRVDTILAKFDVANQNAFAGKVSMIMGKFERQNGDWNFNAIGEPTDDKALDETVQTIVQRFA